MLIDTQGIVESKWNPPGWNSQTFLVSLKFMGGKKYIDARKWVGRHLENQFPSKGLMLQVDHWPHAIEMIQNILKEAEKYKLPNE